MVNQPQETLLSVFRRAAGDPASAVSMSDLIGGLMPAADRSVPDALAQTTQVINAQTQATAANTEAVSQDTQVKRSGSGGNSLTDVVSTVGKFLGGGLSLMPLVSMFSSLFGGDQSQSAPTLLPYVVPPALHLQATNNYGDVVYGEDGLPRASNSLNASSTFKPGGTPAPASGPQITVQVQAIDSRSFLDHSDAIAQAVRNAMLNMNSINDVVNDL